jgi:hypothetical protein
MIEPGIEMVILGNLAISDQGSFPAREIKFLSGFRDELETELHGLECSNMPSIQWPEEPTTDDCTWISRSRSEPYWLTVKTTNSLWRSRLVAHSFADLRYVQRWAECEEAHYIIPASLVVREKTTLWERLKSLG